VPAACAACAQRFKTVGEHGREDKCNFCFDCIVNNRLPPIPLRELFPDNPVLRSAGLCSVKTFVLSNFVD
jgi:hypothetical protein